MPTFQELPSGLFPITDRSPLALITPLASDRMTIIVSKCESGNVPVSVIDLDPAVIRHRFMQEVATRNA